MPRTKTEVEARPTDWSEVVERFVQHLRAAERSHNTIRAYTHDLKLFHEWYQAELKTAPELATIDASDLRAWKSSMNARKQAPQSVNRRLVTVQSLIKWAVAKEWCQAVESPKLVPQVPPPPRWLDRTEELALVRAAKKSGEPRDAALVILLLHAGLRIEEAATTRWSAAEIGERHGSIAIIGKGRKHRTVPLDTEARAALKTWSEWGVAGTFSRIGTDRHIFTGRGGDPVTPKHLGKTISRYGPLIKAFDLTAHVLRHTCLRRWIESGLGLEDVAALAGHESIETTRLYVSPGQADLQALVERRCGERIEPEPTPKPRRRSR